jgi:SAM-dependent methyltransferase
MLDIFDVRVSPCASYKSIDLSRLDITFTTKPAMQDLASSVDTINQRSMRRAVAEYSSLVKEGLNRQERTSLTSVVEEVRDRRILDLGVGAGRTVKPLLEISQQYVGVDYVQEMVDQCRREYPGVRFEQADARSLSGFEDGSFDLVFFSCNGICMVDHTGRLAILSEVLRVLSPGGIFIFSTCNRNSPACNAWFVFPHFEGSLNPARLGVRLARFALQTSRSLMNRLRYRKHQISNDQYALRNDIYHDYGTMLYFIDLRSQIDQLIAAGFAHDVSAFDLAGAAADPRSTDRTLGFVARKPRAS